MRYTLCLSLLSLFTCSALSAQHPVPSVETGKRYGMHTLEQDLARLVRDGRVHPDEAIAAAGDSARLRKLMGTSAAIESPTAAESNLPAQPRTSREPAWAQTE